MSPATLNPNDRKDLILKARHTAVLFARILELPEGTPADPVEDQWWKGQIEDLDFVNRSIMNEDEAPYEDRRTLAVMYFRLASKSPDYVPSVADAKQLGRVHDGETTLEELQTNLGPWYGPDLDVLP